MNGPDLVVATLALITVTGVAWAGGYLWGRYHALQATAPLAPGQERTHSESGAVVFVHEPDAVRGPLAGHVYRALPNPGLDRSTGVLVVFLDDAHQVLNDAQHAAYADGYADRDGEDTDDPEQADAENEPGCTALAATWCLICGRCSCDVDPAVPEDRAGTILDPDCPLHGIYCTHAGQEPLLTDNDPDDDEYLTDVEVADRYLPAGDTGDGKPADALDATPE